MNVNPIERIQTEIASIHTQLAAMQKEGNTLSESQLEKQEKAVANLRKIVDEQLKPELKHAASQESQPLIDKAYEGKINQLDKEIDRALQKIESIRVQATEGGETSGEADTLKDPGLYKLVRVISDEHGKKYVFKDKALDREKQDQMNKDVFPAVVFGFSTANAAIEAIRLKERHVGTQELMNKLGYELNETEGEITLPDAESLNANAATMLDQASDPSDHPLKGFQVTASAGTAEDLEFIDTLLDGKLILSSGSEFTHDHFIHIIADLYIRVSRRHEDHMEELRAVAQPVRRFIGHANEQLTGSAKQETDNAQIEMDLKQLASMLTTWLDINSTRSPGDKILIDEMWKRFSGKGDWSDEAYLAQFNETYPDAPIHGENDPRLTYLLSLMALINLDSRASEVAEASWWMWETSEKIEQIEARLQALKIPFEFNSDGILVINPKSDPITIRDNPIDVMTLLRQKIWL